MIIQLLTQAHGGPVDHAVDVAVELQGRGLEVLVVLEDGPAARRLDVAGVRRLSTGPSSKADVTHALRLARTLRKEKPTVVHCQDRLAGLVGRGLSGVIHAERVIYTLHGVPDSLSGHVAGNLEVCPERRRDRLYYRYVERALLRRTDAVVVPSKALRDYAVDYVGLRQQQVHVVPNGVDIKRFQPANRHRRDGTLDVVWIGIMNQVKRVDVLLRSVARVDGVRVRLAGTGELQNQAHRLAGMLGIEDRVQWLDWVPDPAPLLRDADVLALTSGAENMPLSLLQGMACGAACLATRVGGVPEMISSGHDGLLVPPGDVESTIVALTRLRDDAGLRDALGSAARTTATERFSLARTTDRLLQVYDA